MTTPARQVRRSFSCRPPIARGLLFNMSREIGKVRRVTWRTAKEGERFYVDFGRRGRIFSIPMPGLETGLVLRSAELATEVLESIRTEYANGRSLEAALAPYLPRHAATSKVRHWLPRWLEVKRRERDAGQRSPEYLRGLDRYADPDTGHFSYLLDVSIYDLGYGVLEDWSLWLADRELAPKSRRNVIGAFRAFAGWLKRRGEVASLPEFPTVEVDEHSPTIISRQAQDAVLSAIPEAERGIFLAMARLGVRPGEARTLETRDYRDGWLTVGRAAKGPRADDPVRGTKNRRVRRIPLDEIAPDLATWIALHVGAEARLKGTAPLFRHPTGRSSGARWLPTAMRRTWSRACRASGIHVGLYEGTKHSVGTALIEEGVDERAVQALFGHADLRTTRLYAKLRDPALARALSHSVRTPRAKPPDDDASS